MDKLYWEWAETFLEEAVLSVSRCENRLSEGCY